MRQIRDVSPAGAPRRGRPPSASSSSAQRLADTVLLALARSTRAGPSLGAASSSPAGPTPHVPLTDPHLHPMHTSCIGTELVCIYGFVAAEQECAGRGTSRAQGAGRCPWSVT